MLDKKDLMVGNVQDGIKPVDIVIPELGNKKVRVIPLTKSKLMVLSKLGDYNKEILLNHIVKPKFEVEDLAYIKLGSFYYLIKAVLIASGFAENILEKLGEVKRDG